MGQGKAAIYTEFDSISAFVEDPQKSKVKGKMAYATFPRGPGGKPGIMATVWGLGIPKNSKNPKAGWLFLQWATSQDMVLALQSERAVQGGRDSVWKDARAKAKMHPDLAEALAQGLKVANANWNPPVVAVAEVRDAVGAAIVTSIQGGDVKAAVNKAAADMKRIMAETEKK
jgi:multiple sugar transport system substrate-binding protein